MYWTDTVHTERKGGKAFLFSDMQSVKTILHELSKCYYDMYKEFISQEINQRINFYKSKLNT